MSNVLEVKNLHVHFPTSAGNAQILNGFNIELKDHIMLGLVGESGSGKSVFASAVMGNVKKPGVISEGSIVLDEKVSILDLSEDEAQKIRGQQIALIAANARGHLNPLITVGQQLSEAYMAHHKCKKKEAREKAVQMLEAVGLTDAPMRAKSYPHELSGGMAQRCMIGMALINSPHILIADDATNGLDVTVQAQIMDLIMDMVRERGLSSIFITHDFGVIAQCCQEIAIMYCGQIVEHAPVESFFDNVCHPYSRILINSLPERRTADSNEESTIGLKPDSMNLPTGCLFHPRCKYAQEQCKVDEPGVYEVGEGHCVKCFLYQDGKGGEC